MTDVLQQWLAGLGIHSRDLEQDFSNGFLLGKLLHACNMQPDFDRFVNKGKPDALLRNYTRLQPVLSKLGVKMDTRTAQALINKQPGLAGKVLYGIKQGLAALDTSLQALEHSSREMQHLGVRTSPTRGLLDSQHHKTQHAAYEAGNLKFFEDVMRKRSPSPNRLMELLHLKRFADEGSRQAAAAADAAAAEAAAEQASRAALRDSLRGKLAAGRTGKATKLQRDEAVHATLIKHQEGMERQELRVELALSELSHHRQLEQQAAAAVDAASSIDAFEMTLRRIGAGSSESKADGAEIIPGPDDSPVASLNRIRAFAPTAAKLAESGGEYLAAIKARRQEDLAARREREGRRRRLLVEQQAARAAAEGAAESESLLQVLVRQSAEEQKLAQRLWQLKQEKAAIEADRRLREEQYAECKEREWEESLRREAELHRSVKAQHAAATEQELATCLEQRQARAAAKAAKHAAFARQVAWQVVQLAERVVEFRAATAGQAVPRRDWRAWLAMFHAGDPSLGSPVVSPGTVDREPDSTRQVINTAELSDYLSCSGDWALTDGMLAPPAGSSSSGGSSGRTSSTAGAAAAASAALSSGSTAGGLLVPQQHAALGRVVADLSALAQQLREPAGQPDLQHSAKGSTDVDAPQLLTAAAAVAARNRANPDRAIQACPLKIAVVGGPLAGKSSVAQAVAHSFGLKLLVPEAMVSAAVAAAQAWQQQQQQLDAAQQQQQADGAAEPMLPVSAAEVQQPSELVRLGQQALEELEQGRAMSDELLVQLLLLEMHQAREFAAPPAEPAAPEGKGNKAVAKAAAAGAKAGGQGAAAAAAGASSAGATGTAGVSAAGGAISGCAPGLSRAAPALPAHLAAGVRGRGFVIDGFPATAAQACLLERALTGLDVEGERALVEGASVVAPPPLGALPQLQRPLVSGLDAVLVVECEEEAAAVKRALGRRLDPVTGRLYHLDHDSPPAGVPGLSERLVEVAGPDNDAMQVPSRLASYAQASGALHQWLARFSTLHKPLDGSAELSEVLAGALDAVAGILTAKAAAHAARAAADAAGRAWESAEKANASARAAQSHAEAAARELLAAKKAEIAAAALLNGGKNPDPASTEVLKAQAAAKCAEQLKLCRVAATDAASHADKARAAAEAASEAVQRCNLAVGNAAVSADAEIKANKAAADAETAAAAAIDAARKAEACKQLSQAYVAEAEKWSAASDMPLDAALPSSQQLAAAVAAAVGKSAEPAAAAAGQAAGGVSLLLEPPDTKQLPAAGSLPAPVVPLLASEWQLLEQSFVEGMGRGLAGVRQARALALDHVAASCSWFGAFLKQADSKQVVLQAFVTRFNAVELDMRRSKETQAELLLRCEELRDALWAICDSKNEEAEAARVRLAGDGAAAEHIGLLGQHLMCLVQVELDRFLGTAQFLQEYCLYARGIFRPSSAHAPLGPLPTLLTAAAGAAPSSDGSKPADAAAGGKAGAGVASQPAYLASLQQRLPQLAAALRAATAAAAAAQETAVALVEEAARKSQAAVAAVAATANAAAAAAAAAASGDKAPPASAHRQSAAAGAKAGAAASGAAAAGNAGSKSAAAAASNSSQLAANSEEAAATAAAAVAAAAALPDAKELAAVASELQAALAQELLVLQQRLGLLGSKAAGLVEELVQLRAGAMASLAAWQHKRYVAECGAVAALERLVKAAAVGGTALAHDLRLEDEFLVVDESRLLVAPPPKAPPPRPASPDPPAGVLRVAQLQQLAAALQEAAPGGFLLVDQGVLLMLRMANQGVLPRAWHDIDAPHMAAALATLDPTFTGYFDWRQLLIAMAAAALPAVHTATPAQLAAQAVSFASADRDGDGCVTLEEFQGLRWWWEPQEEAVQAALAEAAWPQQQEGAHGQDEAAAADRLRAAQEMLREAERCQELKQLLWSVFQQQPRQQELRIAAAPAAESAPPQAAAASRPGSGTAAAAATAAAGKVQQPAAVVAPATPTANASASGDKGSSAAVPAAASSLELGEGSSAAPPEPVCSCAILFYLCPDRDLACGVKKALAAAAKSAAAGAAVDAAALTSLCYPLIPPEQAAPIHRAPLSPAQIAAAVAAAAAAAVVPGDGASAVVPAAAGGKPATPAGGGRGSSSGGAPPSTEPPTLPSPPAVKATQLLYSGACERIVTLLLHRYQWVDLYVAARL